MNPLLLPVAALQGVRVKARTEVLPAASGPLAGVAEPPEAEPGAQLRVGVLGESTAAGCGVDSHEEGFTGSFARTLAERRKRRVCWEVVGQYGATSRRIRHKLLPELGTGFDVAVLLAGVNDVLTRRSAAQWREDLEAIVTELAARAERVAVTGIPPFNAFPSLPTTLGRFLAEHAAVLDEVSRTVCADIPAAVWVGADAVLPMGPDFFARDGFHPSALGYRRLAEAVAARV